METNASPAPQSFMRSAWVQLGLLLLFFFIGLFVGQFFGVLLAMISYGYGFEETLAIAGDFRTNADARPILYILQFFSSAGGFLAGSYYYMKYCAPERLSGLRNMAAGGIIPLLLVTAATLTFMVANSLVIEWNANLELPNALHAFEEWAQSQESYLKALTEYLTTFPHTGYLIAALLIIAVVPALGEELFFRGLMQPLWMRILKNPHAAIWLTAFLFSAFHFQFYGLFPRLLLGALFGYFYYWSGSLWLAVLGHFLNNGFSLLMYYIYQQGMMETNLAEPEAVSLSVVVPFLFIGIVAAWALRRHFKPAEG
jgi:membrane protease YdiL (CAAX protease family)